MPKAVFAICLALFVFALIVVQTRAGSVCTPVVRVQPDSVTVKEGDVFNVSVVIENLPVDHGMAGAAFILTWNKTLLNCLGMNEVMYHTITPQDEWGNIWEIRCTVNDSGGYAEYACLWLDGRRAVADGYCPVNGISGNHTLAIVTMEAVGAGSTILNFSSVQVVDFNAAYLLNIDENVYEPPDNGNSGIENVTRQTEIDNSTFETFFVSAEPFSPIMVFPGRFPPLNITVPYSLSTGPATTPTKISYSPQTAPSLGNMTEVQKQGAMTITEVPVGMLAAIVGILITSSANWRRCRKNH